MSLSSESTELKTYLENLEGIKLKSGNKTKVTIYALIESEDLDTNINNIINKIKYKFREENINDDRIIQLCALHFQKELIILSDIISNQSDLSASEYVDDLFFKENV